MSKYLVSSVSEDYSQMKTRIENYSEVNVYAVEGT